MKTKNNKFIAFKKVAPLTLVFLFTFIGSTVFIGCTKDKKSSGSTVVVTPAPSTPLSCSNYTQQNGFYFDANRNAVTCSNGDPSNCVNYRFDTTRGFYVDTAGNRVSCNFNNLFSSNSGLLPYSTTQGYGCGAYNQGLYYPVLMGNNMVCVNQQTLASQFTTTYLNSIYGGYYGQAWMPGRPILASCQMNSTFCKCSSKFWGMVNWCWTASF